MAIKFCDGMDSAAASGDLTKKWFLAQSPWVWTASAGRFGGGAAVAATTGGGFLQCNPGTLSGTDQAASFYMKASAIPASSSVIFEALSSGSANIFNMGINLTTGFAYANSPSGSTTLTTAFNVCDNKWHHIEIKNTNTQIILYIDGVNQGTIGSNFLSQTMDYFYFKSVTGITLTISQPIIYDSTAGAMITTSFPYGPRQITTTRPTSDGTVNFATLSSGTTHFSLVNEVNPDGDTSYVEDGTSGNQDLLNFGALGFTPSVITAVALNAYVENAQGGSINIQGVCKSGVTTSAGTSKATPATYQTFQWFYVTDPNTSAAWAVSGLNSAQFGYKNP